jgi:hypothetical protein
MCADLARAWSDARVLERNGRRLMSALKGRDGDPDMQASVSKVFASVGQQRIGEAAMRATGPSGELVGPGYGLDRLQQVTLGSRAESIDGGRLRFSSTCSPNGSWGCRVNHGEVTSPSDNLTSHVSIKSTGRISSSAGHPGRDRREATHLVFHRPLAHHSPSSRRRTRLGAAAFAPRGCRAGDDRCAGRLIRPSSADYGGRHPAYTPQKGNRFDI